jgi:hypothetical protein
VVFGRRIGGWARRRANRRGAALVVLSDGDCHENQHEQEDSAEADQVGDEAKESHGRLA